MTRLLTADQIDQAAALMRDGELVAFPTETVYGLGAGIFRELAIQKIFRAKGRPSDNPLIAHIAHLEDVEKIAIDIPPSFYLLAEAFFPGPLTVVLKRHPDVPSCVSGGLETIAVRMPSHLLARALIEQVGEPIVAPSANLSGKPSSTNAQHVLHDFAGKIAAVLDGGECPIGIESTVISLYDQPVLLRPGAITRLQLEEVLQLKVATCSSSDKPQSPGMKYRHYAPNAPIQFFESVENLTQYVSDQPAKKRLILSSHVDHFFLSAKTLYAMLRLSDTDGYQEILIVCDEQIRSDEGLMNRLIRSGGFHEGDHFRTIR
jgi:L-threonylcarbamoyladenylate synthase